MRSMALDDWKTSALGADILIAAMSRGAALRRVGQEWVGPCPVCGGSDRFCVAPRKRLFICRGFGGGTVIDLVMHLDGVSFMQACEALTGEPPPRGESKPLTAEQRAEWARRQRAAEQERQSREAAAAAYQEDTRDAALSIWNECIPIFGTVSETYLHKRGMPTPPGGWPSVLRHHPSLYYPNGKRYPALVCRVDDVDGEFTAIWRTYLSPDGAGKADVPNAKLGLGPAGGGAVRIGGVGPRIGIAEGLESALGGWNLIGRAYPVWAALSTSGMTAIELPLGVTRATLFPDGDIPVKREGGEYVPVQIAPGRKAARALKDRLVAEGVACTIACEPPPAHDYCDLWNAHAGAAA